MLRVLALNGCEMATLPMPSSGHEIKEQLRRQGVEEVLQLVWKNGLLCDGDLAHDDVTVVRRPRPNILIASNKGVAVFEPMGEKVQSVMRSQVMGAVPSPNGQLWFLAMEDGSVEVYEQEAHLCTLQGAPRHFQNVVWSPEGAALLVPCLEELRLFDARSGEQLRSYGGLRDVRLSVWQEGALLCVTRDGFAKLFLAAREEPVEMDEVGKWTGSVHFVGALVLAVLRDGTARLFGRDGRERVKLPAQRVSDAAVCKDKVVLGLSDCTARVYHMEGERVAKAISLESLGVYIPAYPITFSKDGSKLLFALDSCAVKVFDTHSGELIYTCPGDSHHVTSASFSPDGRDVLVSYYSTVARIFDATGHCASEFRLPEATYTLASFL